MSMSLVWFAAHGIDPELFLDRAGFSDTGDPDEYFDEEHSGGTLAGGWYVIVSNDVGLLDPAKVAAWSEGGRVVAVALDEESLNAMAIEWMDGKLVWSAAYDGSEGGEELAIEGKLPAVFEELQHEASALQAEGGGAEHVFDIPLDLAADVTGFRHDELGFDDDIGPFTALERVHIA
ncbi:MAG: hypothetical protein EON61_01090 [Alphaproteobacteria bacterium]|nr:MAG: hypothetical protein EON61_01090 [Alphaproteobacteria bacterium]